MADPICRWRNSSVKQVVEFNLLFPLTPTDKINGRNFVEKNWNMLGGKDFFTTPYQLAAQMALYYEDDSMLYPRFNKLISLDEAYVYMQRWGRYYYAPNPYTKSMQQNQKPVVLNNFLTNWVIEKGNGASFNEALKEMFVDSIGNNDILINMINNFMDVRIEDNKVFLKNSENVHRYSDEEVWPNISINDKIAFFEYVGGITLVSNELLSKSATSKQIIYYGAPGTGKSNTIKKEVDEKGKINYRTTFHPDSDYSTFVGAYKPTMKRSEKLYTISELTAKLKEIKETGVTYPCHKFAAKYWESVKDLSAENIKQILSANGFTESMATEVSKGVAIGQEYLNNSKDGKIIYSFVPQAFTKAYVKAWKTTEDVYLIIEEINRGNCAQIFGDLFQLLDRKDGESEYPVDADSDLEAYLAEQFANDDIPNEIKEGKKLVLPKNLYIWATMNTSDQSLFPIDSAFKRRWDWKYVPIANANKNWKIRANGNLYDWWDFIEKVNDKIWDATHSEDKKLGYFFCKAKDKEIDAVTFVEKVVFYLWNDVFKDFELEGDVFDDVDGKLTFNKFYSTDGQNRVLEDKVAQFLNNLKVKIDNGEPGESYDVEVSDETAKSQRKEILLSIQIPGCPLIKSEESNRFAAVVQALNIIGSDKIIPQLGSIKYKRLGCPVLTIQKDPVIENNNSGYTYYEVNGLYIIKGCKSYTYIRILEDLDKLLNIGLTLETK